MLFNSITFAAFFVAFFVLYFAAKNHYRTQNVLILAGSYFFYGWWDERFLILIAISTSADYIAGLGTAGRRLTRDHLMKAFGFVFVLSVVIPLFDWPNGKWVLAGGIGFILLAAIFLYIAERVEIERRKTLFVIGSVTVNLGVLGFFKYFNFFAGSLMSAVAQFGVQPDWVTLNIVLPVGISFYTFQTMSYTLDIYRRDMEPTSRFLEHAAFVSFFPQLVAGPIERARNLLPQFAVVRKITADGLRTGLILFVWGLFKKVVIADNLAPIANEVFANPGNFSAGELSVGVLAFTFQIYCDFSGYSDMARAIARMLGFDLMLNFNIPYVARTPSEFWRRWHISLSTWLRDYLYIGLGGNKRGNAVTYRNLILTMLLGGLWHGAAWTFIAWGGVPRSVAGHLSGAACRFAPAKFPRASRLPGAAQHLFLGGHVPPDGDRLDSVPGTVIWRRHIGLRGPVIRHPLVDAGVGRISVLHMACHCLTGGAIPDW